MALCAALLLYGSFELSLTDLVFNPLFGISALWVLFVGCAILACLVRFALDAVRRARGQVAIGYGSIKQAAMLVVIAGMVPLGYVIGQVWGRRRAEKSLEEMWLYCDAVLERLEDRRQINERYPHELKDLDMLERPPEEYRGHLDYTATDDSFELILYHTAYRPFEVRWIYSSVDRVWKQESMF